VFIRQIFSIIQETHICNRKWTKKSKEKAFNFRTEDFLPSCVSLGISRKVLTCSLFKQIFLLHLQTTGVLSFG